MVQDTFEAALRGLHTLTDPTGIKAWLDRSAAGVGFHGSVAEPHREASPALTLAIDDCPAADWDLVARVLRVELGLPFGQPSADGAGTPVRVQCTANHAQIAVAPPGAAPLFQQYDMTGVAPEVFSRTLGIAAAELVSASTRSPATRAPELRPSSSRARERAEEEPASPVPARPEPGDAFAVLSAFGDARFVAAGVSGGGGASLSLRPHPALSVEVDVAAGSGRRSTPLGTVAIHHFEGRVGQTAGVDYPRGRTNYDVFFQAGERSFYVVGGHASIDEPLNDVWRFDTRSLRWERIDTPGGPTPRGLHRTARVGELGLLFGGGDAEGARFSDLWALDLAAADRPEATATWRLVFDDLPTPYPSERWQGTVGAVGGAVYLFGGSDSLGRSHNDLWRLTP